jgi:hypothetical protein
MAVYKIFPIKDSYISYDLPNFNYGRDEIFEIRSNPKSRALIQFSDTEINTLIASISGSYLANLKLYISETSNLPIDYSIEVNPLTQYWDMGTGRNGDNPNPQNGVSWNNSTLSTSWVGGSYLNYGINQSFNYQDNKDIDIDITQIVQYWYDEIIPNYGLMLKYPDLLESSSLEINTNFYTSDTHTIYPPELEIQWSDTTFNSLLNKINNNSFVTSITNLKNEFNSENIHKFRIKNRDKYPARQFKNSSVYLNTKILPEESYWALKDVKTKEIIIDYNEIGTKLGADNEGNYFTLYMNGLQPERYYQILIKTSINGDTIIIDNKSNYFKVIE